MTAKSNRRGHEIIWRDGFWQYSDIDKIANYDRPCTRCGKMPLPHGYDACLGSIAGVKHACCGHGVENPFFIQDDDGQLVKQAHYLGGEMRKKIITYILIGAAFIIALWIRFSNPDLTETRLFLTFWREWVFVVFLYAMALALTYWDLTNTEK